MYAIRSYYVSGRAESILDGPRGSQLKRWLVIPFRLHLLGLFNLLLNHLRRPRIEGDLVDGVR